MALAPEEEDVAHRGQPWPVPSPLDGVKSRRKPIFSVESAQLAVGDGVSRVSKLRLALESRIVAVGAAGRSVVELLLKERSLVQGRPKSHEHLKAVRLGADAAWAGCDASDAAESMAVASVARALEARPQVVVVDEAGDEVWSRAFHRILASEQLRTFRGAVVVCVEEETPEVRSLYSKYWERWAGADGWLWQESVAGDGLELWEDVLGKGGLPPAAEPQALLEEVAALSQQLFSEDSVAIARERDWTLSLLMDPGASRLCGFMCHKLPCPGRNEMHVLRLAVPPALQKHGHGHRMLLWVLRKAARMPASQCAWIGLSSLDAAIPFYEKFGFVDMTCDDLEADGHFQTWMELQNVSVGCEEPLSRESTGGH